MRLALLVALVVVGCSQPVPVTSPDPAPATSGPEIAGPVFAGPMRADPVFDAETLVGAMAAAYPDWYRTLTFTQRTSRRTPTGVSVETWREWMALPGRLRIEMDDPLAGVDVLFVGDTTFVYRDGALADARADRNPLLLWGFDVYTQPAAATLAVLQTEGIDLDAFRVDVWDGREMYVVGTPETAEVWVEKERLLFARLLEPGGAGTQDVRFENYQRLGGGWIAPYVAVFQGDTLVFWETYSDMVADPDLDSVLFDPRRWAEGVASGG